MTLQSFWSLTPGDRFRYPLRDQGIYIKRSLTSAELITHGMRVEFYFAPDAEVVLLPAPPEQE